MQNPECKHCGLLLSTVRDSHCACVSESNAHDFGTETGMGDVERWWEQEPYKTRGPLSDYFHIERILAEQRRRDLQEFVEIVKEIKNVNESNGRYNACDELLSCLHSLKSKNEE